MSRARWFPREPDVEDDLPQRAPAEVDVGQLVQGIRLSGSLADPQMDDVEFTASEFVRLSVSGGRIGRCSLTDVIVRRSDCVAVELPDARIQRVVVEECKIAGSGLDGGFVEDARLLDVSAARTSWRSSTLRRVTFTGCDLVAADFGGAVLDRVTFEHCTLTRVEVSGARMTKVAFTDCDLSGLAGAQSLRGCTVDAASLAGLSGPMAATLGIELV